MIPEKHTSRLIRATNLSPSTSEVSLTRPAGFTFLPGQRIRFLHQGLQRDYTMISGPQENQIRLCIHHVAGGQFSGILISAPEGTGFTFTGPHGYFQFAASDRQAVFVATGTGIAPFVAFVQNHVSGFILLHGVPDPAEQYYKQQLSHAASLYVPCFSRISGTHDKASTGFHGRVTDYLEAVLPLDVYDFYLCGKPEMISDSLQIIDERFPASKVFTESYE